MPLSESKTYLGVDSLVNLLIGVTGIILNATQIALVKQKGARRIFDYTLLSLGMSDLMAALLFVLNGVILLLMALGVRLGLSPAAYQSIHHAKFCFALNCSFMHVLFIAAQRLLAVKYPFRLNLIITKTRCISCLVFIWIASVAFDAWSTWQFAGVPFDSLPAILFTYVSVVTGFLLFITYAFICYQLAKRKNTTTAKQTTAQNQRVVRYAIAITVLYFVSIFPAATMTFMRYQSTNAYLTEFPYWMIGFNVPLNPIVYFWLSNYKREHKSLCAVCFRGNRQLQPQATRENHISQTNTAF